MNLEWTARALADLDRLYDFLAPVNPRAAAETVLMLVEASMRLLEFPRVGARLEKLHLREVRHLIVAGRYELRYEIEGETINVIRVFHARENR
jgi:plasmid stabilization system protein ParE